MADDSFWAIQRDFYNIIRHKPKIHLRGKEGKAQTCLDGNDDRGAGGLIAHIISFQAQSVQNGENPGREEWSFRAGLNKICKFIEVGQAFRFDNGSVRLVSEYGKAIVRQGDALNTRYGFK